MSDGPGRDWGTLLTPYKEQPLWLDSYFLIVILFFIFQNSFFYIQGWELRELQL